MGFVVQFTKMITPCNSKYHRKPFLYILIIIEFVGMTITIRKFVRQIIIFSFLFVPQSATASVASMLTSRTLLHRNFLAISLKFIRHEYLIEKEKKTRYYFYFNHTESQCTCNDVLIYSTKMPTNFPPCAFSLQSTFMSQTPFTPGERTQNTKPFCRRLPLP